MVSRAGLLRSPRHVDVQVHDDDHRRDGRSARQRRQGVRRVLRARRRSATPTTTPQSSPSRRSRWSSRARRRRAPVTTFTYGFAAKNDRQRARQARRCRADRRSLPVDARAGRRAPIHRSIRATYGTTRAPSWRPRARRRSTTSPRSAARTTHPAVSSQAGLRRGHAHVHGPGDHDHALRRPPVACCRRRSPRASRGLRGPGGCVRQAFRARVSGRSIAAVAFYVDGKLVKNMTGERAVYRLKVRPGRFGFGRHKLIARVTFATGSGTQARRLPLTFRRCAQDAVAPRFTG